MDIGIIYRVAYRIVVASLVVCRLLVVGMLLLERTGFIKIDEKAIQPPQMRGAYTGPVLAAERLHKSVPSRQNRTLVPEKTGTYQGKGRDASEDRHGRGQRRADLL